MFHILLEGTPKHIDVYKLHNDIEELGGLTLIHDVHCWTITSGKDAFTAHALVDPSYQGSFESLRNRIQDITHNRYGIDHVTVQLEQTAVACTGEDHHVEHLPKPRSRPPSRLPGNRDLPWRLHEGPSPYAKRPIPSKAAAT